MINTENNNKQCHLFVFIRIYLNGMINTENNNKQIHLKTTKKGGFLFPSKIKNKKYCTMQNVYLIKSKNTKK